jgi:serine protease Do
MFDANNSQVMCSLKDTLYSLIKSRAPITLTLLSFTALVSAQTLEPEALFKKVSPSIWQVVVFDKANQPLGSGSGVVIAQERVVTNCHVLANASRVAVMREKVVYEADLEFPDPERDLCQLRVKDLIAPAVELADVSKLQVGQKIYAVGNPLGLVLTLSDGLISSLRLNQSDRLEAIQITAPISSGSSGGGLFDNRGLLIGITTRGVVGRNGAVAQNLNFAIPAFWIAELPLRGQEALAKLDPKALPARSASASNAIPVPQVSQPSPPSPLEKLPAEVPRTVPRTLSPLPNFPGLTLAPRPQQGSNYLPGQSVNGERRITGAEIAKQFAKPVALETYSMVRGLNVLVTDTDRKFTITSRYDESVGRGTFKVSEVTDEICFNLITRVFGWMNGCFSVYQYGVTSFNVRNSLGRFSFDYSF